jgi:two-component system response regulator GlrR
MIGNSAVFVELTRLIRKIAGCDAPVLLEGETGTGKDLAARAIHYEGARRSTPFVPVNCGAIPDSLIESELFGHRKGAFTDAKQDRVGLFAYAHAGTLFLDEVDTLSAKGQVTLLRFLQDQQYRPLGGVERSADVRIIAAGNADLVNLAREGKFRLDLLFRLKILHLVLPPLRARNGDTILLAEHFMRACSARFNQPAKTFHPDTLAWFDRYAWPGNIRELENLIYREFVLTDGPEIRVNDSFGSERADDPWHEHNFNQAKAKAIAGFEKAFLTRLMAQTGGNITRAAKIAGKERRALGKLLKKHDIVNADLYRPGTSCSVPISVGHS